MKWAARVLVMAGLFGSLALPAVPAHAATQKLLGVVPKYPAPGSDFSVDAAGDMEAWQGKKNAVINFFSRWSESVAVDLAPKTGRFYQIFDKGKSVPMLTWTPMCRLETIVLRVCLGTGGLLPVDDDPDPAIATKIANGRFDPYILSYGAALREFLTGPDQLFNTTDDRRAYLRFAHEANGDWYPWSPAFPGGDSYTDPMPYKRMWWHVHDLLMKPVAEGGLAIPNNRLAWVWNVSAVVFTGNRPSAADMYPGDQYVDWVSLDGYNRGSYRSSSQIFDPMMAQFATFAPTKPISIAEYGSDLTTSEKKTWFQDFLSWAVGKDPLRMVVVFNSLDENGGTRYLGSFNPSPPTDNGDQTFTREGRTYVCYSTYKTGVQQSIFAGANPANPQLLTDASFLGN